VTSRELKNCPIYLQVAFLGRLMLYLVIPVYEHFWNHCTSVSGIGVRRTPDLPIGYGSDIEFRGKEMKDASKTKEETTVISWVSTENQR